jgi:hypothetical protein
MPRRAHVREALQSSEIRNACAVLSNVHAAMMLVDTLSPATIEALRDEFDRMAKERTGPRGELKHAWTDYMRQALHDALLRKQQDALGMYAAAPHRREPVG